MWACRGKRRGDHGRQFLIPVNHWKTDYFAKDYIKATAISTWHPCGTVKMGKPEDPGTCVDTSFKVVGLEGLRVVDMSIAPILPR